MDYFRYDTLLSVKTEETNCCIEFLDLVVD